MFTRDSMPAGASLKRETRRWIRESAATVHLVHFSGERELRTLRTVSSEPW